MGRASCLLLSPPAIMTEGGRMEEVAGWGYAWSCLAQDEQARTGETREGRDILMFCPSSHITFRPFVCMVVWAEQGKEGPR